MAKHKNARNLRASKEQGFTRASDPEPLPREVPLRYDPDAVATVYIV